MRLLYILRVALVSNEALVIAVTFLILTYFNNEIDKIAASVAPNEEILG